MMMLYKKAQAGILIPIMMFILGIVIWAVYLGNFLAEYGARAISLNNLTGLEAFFYGNLNLVYFLILILAMVVSYAVGGSSE